MKYTAKTSFAIGVLCALSILPKPANAESFFVDWEGAYLSHETGGQKLNLGPETSIFDGNHKIIGVGFTWSEDAPISPKSPRYDLTKPSALFYGTLQVINPIAAASDEFPSKVRPMSQVTAAYGKNVINLGSTAAEEGSPARLTGFLFWPKKSFLGNPTTPISWSEIPGVTAGIAKINTKPGPAEVRIAVRSGGKWYLSETTTDRPGALRVTDLSWGEWDVGTTLPLPSAPKTYKVKSATLNDITAVGVYFDVTSSEPPKNAVFSVDSFQVESSRKPEKS
ncbi:hypothetical protein BH09VER1_BH09VER1_25370 [soil metagenome]